MRKTPKYIFLLFAVCIAFIRTSAQTYPFDNYTAQNGLSQSQVISVFQNASGQMWFGTSGGGITTFDGRFFEYITDKEGLADNVIFSMAQDKNGRVLIGTNNGLSVYDPLAPAKNRITNYGIKNGLSHERIFSIYLNEDGSAVLGTGKGVSLFKDNKCSVKKINSVIDSSAVYSIYTDQDKNTWYNTLGNGTIVQKGNQFIHYSVNNGLLSNVVFNVLQIDKNTHWILSGEGLFELKNGSLKQVFPPNTGISATFYCYYTDKNKTIWLGSSEGVLKFSNGHFETIRKKNGLDDNIVWKIIEDKESNIWFATDQGGVFKLASERFLLFDTKDGLLFDEVKRIYQNKNGEYWIGTKNGISVYANKTSKNYTYKELKGNPDIWAITQNKENKYLIGTTNGLFISDGTSFKRVLCRDPENPMNTVLDVFVDKSDKVWLGTQAGVAKLENGFIEPNNDVKITNNYINKIFQDNNNNYWFCTDDGLFIYDGKNIKKFGKENGLNAERIRGGVIDKNGIIWFATNAGAFKFNNNKFTNVLESLDITSMEVYSIAIDKYGNIWAGLSNGVARISNNGKNHNIRLYTEDDGFKGQVCSQNAMILDNNGQLVIGTSKGMIIYNDKFDSDNILEPITKLKSIDLFYQKTDWKLYCDSVDVNNMPFYLELPYDKNYLTFNFIGISLTAPGKVIYKYKLKGIDTDWRTSGKTDASYSNLPPGQYEFIVMANNGEGVWNKEPVVFKFVILPPFWRTWWFYSIIVIIILSGIYSYIKIRAANFKILKQNEIIEEKNEALLNANVEIAEKNRNITDSINYAKRIQRSFITSDKVLKDILKEHFVLFKPRDIVSGDFYMAFDQPDRTVVVCADCTGHGIPGAFMSLIGISLLNEISRSVSVLSTSEILEQLRNSIISALNPEKNEAGGKDGMDISVIAIFKQTVNGKVKIEFSGANSTIQLINFVNGASEMQEYKGDKQPVGYHSQMKAFTSQEIFANKGDIIYLYTDGYADQFGGLSGKKFMAKQLKQHISSICHLPLNEQKQQLYNTLSNWQGKLEQVDDVTVIGIKL